jgi:uncharacterized protein YecA (UPF0149 family)
MTRTEVRAFIKSGCEAVSVNYPFNSGRLTEFNSQLNNTYPYLWLESLKTSVSLTTTQMPFDNWEISIFIAKLDKMDSLPIQYESIVDDCDLIAQKLVYQLNQAVEGFKLSILDNITREPFIKEKHVDCISGVNLSFTLGVPDTTNVC